MSRWDDPAIRDRARQLGGKVMLAVREAKRAEAIERSAATPHENTRAHRAGRCPCWLPERASKRPGRRQQAACPWPGKVAYATPQEAAWVQGKHGKWRRNRQGLHAYPCPAGHVHLGRLYTRLSAWARAV